MWLGVDLRMDIKKTCVLEDVALDYMLKYVDYSKLSDQFNWRGPL